MSFSNYWEKAALCHVFGILAYAPPAAIHVGLSTANPTEDGSGNAEPAGGAYARVVTAPANWIWNNGTSRVENAVRLNFPNPTAPWGLITHFTLWDAALGGGNFLDYAALGTAKQVNAGDPPYFDPGALTFAMD